MQDLDRVKSESFKQGYYLGKTVATASIAILLSVIALIITVLKTCGVIKWL